MLYLLKGILIGLIFGIPVGAVGTLTLNRTINFDSKRGFITGLGSSCADVLYAGVGVFGITLITDFIIKYQMSINIIGASLIILLGVSSIIQKQKEVTEKRKDLINTFITSFAIGITYPTTILSFIFAFSYFKITDISNTLNGLLLILGIFLGTIIWWTILVIIGNLIKKKMNKEKIDFINKIFAGILIIIGMVILIKTFI